MIWQATIAAAALMALIYWVKFSSRADGAADWAASWVKTGSTGLLAFGFWLLGAPGWLVLGLGLGAIGDFALSRQGQRWFLAGMAAFAAGHLAYAGWMAAMTYAWAQGQGGYATGMVQYLGGGLLVALLLSTEVWLAPATGALRGAVRAYVLVIGLMAAAALFLPALGTASAIVRMGAGLFVLSDLLLAMQMFLVTDPSRARALRLSVWPLYWIGQALILVGGTHFADLTFG